MTAAQVPRARDMSRLLVIDRDTRTFRDAMSTEFADFLSDGDLLVVNDAATLPASFRVRMPSGADAEARLAGRVDDVTWNVVLFGAGDWRTATELRDPPENVHTGDEIQIALDVTMKVIEVSKISARLVTVRFNRSGPGLWTALYAYGRPIQYSHLSDDLELWSVQTIYAGRPWAVEMPSAGYALSWRTMRRLIDKGVGIARITHAAGLSSTGDEELDDALPLPERFDIPSATVAAAESTRLAGGRVIAVGTTVVRAIEGASLQNDGRLVAGSGVTDLVIGPGFRPAVVSGVLTGIHDPSQSHFRLLRAFADEATLRRALRHATESGYLSHEFGDSCLIIGARFHPAILNTASDTMRHT